ncbi:hypothetical protein [Streptomyces cylindrosporus]|uniref:Uncharacterized protein n=1 Tax=Streptomyces cylindrosporus TaxID=2927583 RepID=A0ABS9YG76_9ACTN|nr:hypothetical protein [Streptomyces cylindrosporus]MCI3276231.1 hypothetical protein [Streptomyces cylindrosporus]
MDSDDPVDPEADGDPDEDDPDDDEEGDDDDDDEDEDEDEEWGGCGWLSGIALQGLRTAWGLMGAQDCTGLGAAQGRRSERGLRSGRKITQSESSLGWRYACGGEERNSRTGVVRSTQEAYVARGRAGRRAATAPPDGP